MKMRRKEKKIELNDVINEKKVRFHVAFFDFLALFFGMSIVMFAGLYFIETKIIQVQAEEIKEQQFEQVEIESHIIGDEIDGVISDFAYLVSEFKTHYVNSNETATLSRSWLRFSQTEKIFDQIRFINVDGWERIRINYDENGAYIVEQRAMQKKGDRYYFEESIDLEPGEVFVSRMDLNVEEGEIEEPIKPMIRFAGPVFNLIGKRQGVVVVNYKAGEIIDALKGLPNFVEQKRYLLDAKGYWLSSDDPNQEWGFMYEGKQDISFANDYPEVWAQFDADKGQVITKDGMFTYSKVFIEEKLVRNREWLEDERIIFEEGSWIVVSFIPAESATGYYFSPDFLTVAIGILNDNRITFLSIIGLALLISILVYMVQKAQKKVKFYSMYDDLTLAYTRGAGMNLLRERMPADSRRKTSATICFIDVNGLKQVNDNLGHVAGDELLVTVTEVIRNTIRERDILIRMGGDEFMIVLCRLDEQEAERVWNRILDKFKMINEKENRPYMISVSHGVVEIDNQKTRDMDTIITMADELMYEEKKKIKKDLDVLR